MTPRSPQKARDRIYLYAFLFFSAIALSGVQFHLESRYFDLPAVGYPLWKLQTFSEDYLVRTTSPRKPHPDLVFVAIDAPDYTDMFFDDEIEAEPILAKLKNFPWERDVYQFITQRLIDAGARVVVLDLLFIHHQKEDDEFAAFLKMHRDKTVLGGQLRGRVLQGQEVTLDLPLGLEEHEIDVDNPLGLVGYVTYWPESDGVLRRMYYSREIGTHTVASLSLRAAQKAEPSRAWKNLYAPRRLQFYGLPTQGFPMHPIHELFSPHLWKEQFEATDYFKNKIVMIGPFGDWAHDYGRTPYGALMPGPEIHLTALNNLLTDSFYQQASGGVAFIYLLLALLMAAVSSFVCQSPLWRLFLLIVCVGVYLLVAYVAFIGFNLFLPVALPCVGAGYIGIVGTSYDFFKEQREKRKVRRMFSTMVSPYVLNYMMEDLQRFSLVGERKEASVFFSDLEGFTTISEKLLPEELSALLNHIFSESTQLIMDHHGYVDKYIGDAVMADFGVPVWQDDDPHSHAWRACYAALEQQDAIETIARDIKKRYGESIRIRMGINTGIVSAGNMGSIERFQYTVMGDTVNLAARLEAANKIFGTRILIGEPTYLLAKDKIETRLIANLQVKGKQKPVPCYELIAKKSECDEAQLRKISTHNQAMEHFFNRQWQEAINGFQAVLSEHPSDKAAAIYLAQSQDYFENAPPDDWQGEYIQTSK